MPEPRDDPHPGTPSARLTALRAELARRGLDGMLVPRSDAHLGEYVPPAAERLAWISGFTGSAGLAIVTTDTAVLFSDGRYTEQAERETDPALWQRAHITEAPPATWLKEHAAGRRIGYDPFLHAEPAIERLGRAAMLVPLEGNPIDAIWHDRPPSPTAPAMPHPLALAGTASAIKRENAARLLREAGEDLALLADPHSVAWLLNLRGADLAHTPLLLAFALLHADATVTLFADPSRIPEALRREFGNAVALAAPDTLKPALDALAGKRVRIDADATPAWFAATLRAAGATIAAGEDPCRLPRAIKNETEQQGARAAHARDGIALARFMAWFATAAPGGGLTEMSVAARLLAFRAALPRFHGESFPAIVGAGPHGAIVHYRATPETDRAIGRDECVLIDSGAQFQDGTTDVTRTFWTGPGAPPAALVRQATAVLRGHIALATLRFPEGVAGPHLDSIARRPLWDQGLDYDHGTGHGVGSFLSVHEGPAAFSRLARVVPLLAGMILSNEPGFYRPGAYGMRIENLLLTVPAAPMADAVKPFLAFETLTLAPYNRRLIDPAALTVAERRWVDAHHARVLAAIGPALDPADRAWLTEACAPLGGDPPPSG